MAHRRGRRAASGSHRAGDHGWHPVRQKRQGAHDADPNGRLFDVNDPDMEAVLVTIVIRYHDLSR